MTAIPAEIHEAEARHELERRKNEWLYEDDRDREVVAPFTEHDAQTLRNLHIAVRSIGEPPFVVPSSLYCLECGMPWTNGGCPTVRLLGNWRWQTRRIRQLRKRVDNMAEFLAEWFAWRYVGRRGRVAECSLRVDEEMLARGRMAVVDQLLMKMRDQWREFLEQMFPKSQTEQFASALNESLANIERDKRRAAGEVE